MDLTTNINFDSKLLTKLSNKAEKSSYIDPQLFNKYEVKRGLRDLNGKGVLAGPRSNLKGSQ